MEKQNVKNFMIGSLVGGVIGAVTALLFAPKPGVELRSDLADGFHTVSDKTQEIARDLGNQTTEFISKAKEVASRIVEGARNWNEEENADIEVNVASSTPNFVSEEEEEEELVLIVK